MPIAVIGRCRVLATCATLLVSVPGLVGAQTSAGVGDDAVPVPAHGARIRIGGLWTSADKRFAPSGNGGTKKTGLFDGYARDSFGVGDLPTLAPVESNIRALSGLGNSFALSFGALEATGDVSRSIVPFQLDYGVTSRLSVTVVVPYVETRANSRFVLNRGGQGASVGVNPAFSSSGNARATNTIVVGQIDASRNALASEISRCATATEMGGGCDAIRANPTAAQSLLSQSATFLARLADLYGTATVTGAPVVPISQSAVQTAIEAQLASIRTQFIDFGSNNLDPTSRPVGATVIYGSAGLQEIAKDAAFELENDTLAIGGRAGMGDVDLAATFLWLNTRGASQYDRLNVSRRALRSNITAGFRFGTATGGRSGNPFDLPTGDGANALLARSTTDLIWSGTTWISGTIRYIKPLTDHVVTRFAPVSDSNLFKPFAQLPAERTLGTRTEIEIAPRFGIGRSFALSAAYVLSHQSGATLIADADASPNFPILVDATFSTPALTIHSVQFGAAYSSLSAFTRGKSRWPLEIVYSHGLTLAGSGGVVPATVSDQIELRIYTRFPRR